MKHAALLGALFVLCFVPCARAQVIGNGQFSGNELVHACEVAIPTQIEDKDWIEAFYCLGYLSGARAAIGFERDINYAESVVRPKQTGPPVFRICIPEEATQDQLAKVVVKYLNDHPERLHEDAFLLVFAAYSDAFPCPKKPKKP
jgi:hypothetical protein